jgi:hypothetical protein
MDAVLCCPSAWDGDGERVVALLDDLSSHKRLRIIENI